MICLWDIGDPAPPKYKNSGHRMLVKVEYEGSTTDLYSMAWVAGAAQAGSWWAALTDWQAGGSPLGK